MRRGWTDDGGEERAEGLGPPLRLEVQLGHQILPVIDWAADPISQNAGLISGVGEAVERRLSRWDNLCSCARCSR